MSKTLVIAEKPSVAADLAKVLRVPKHGDIFENDEYAITSAVGHLVELQMPEDIDPKLKRWTLKNLPIIPEKFGLKPREEKGAPEKFNFLKKQLHRKDIGAVVNACDAGREGELIFTYIYELAGAKTPYKRLWLTSMTPDAIRAAFDKLRPSKEVQPLCDAARCRSESDWLVGLNGTRAVTLRMYGHKAGQFAPVGRVQTPTLSLVVEREKVIRDFKPRAFWRLEGAFGLKAGEYSGVYQKPGFKKADEGDAADRLWDKAAAEKLLAECRAAKTATVTEEKTRKTEASPKLYDLTTLQREANNRFGLPAAKTLSIAQSLYEKHKAITYPRTDSRALPEDYIPNCVGVLGALSRDRDFAAHAERVSKNGWVRPNKRIFNNKEVSDHFAIIPTDQVPDGLRDDEAKIYDMIVRRFLAVFHPAAEFDITERTTTVAAHPFLSKGKVLVKPGWKEVYGKVAAKDDDEAEATLPALAAGEAASIEGVALREDKTKPPARYTEATLLSAMEGAGKLVDDEELAAALKERGLGTPATRAAIIENLFATKYLERQQRELLPTAKAEQLVEFLHAVGIEALTSAAMTGRWEQKLRLIEQGELTRESFMREIAEETRSLVEKTGGFTEDADSAEELADVQWEGKPLLSTLRDYRSQQTVKVGEAGKEKELPAFILYKSMGNRKIEPAEVAELIAQGKVGPLEGFRSKFGKPYKASLQLVDKDGQRRAEFVFENRAGAEGEEGAAPVDYSACEVIGVCPNTGLKVYDTPKGFRTNPEEAKGAKSQPFSISKMMLSKPIEKAQAIKLLTEKKTDLLTFVSNKTKRPFDAFLTLRKDGRIGFEFPPRAPKAKAAPADGEEGEAKKPAKASKSASKIAKIKEAAGDAPEAAPIAKAAKATLSKKAAASTAAVPSDDDVPFFDEDGSAVAEEAPKKKPAARKTAKK